MKIKLLDQDLVNKIAAGEVIERPASAVKELVENALDAGATSIMLDIGEGGKSYIKISDNGEGMTEEDARLCILKHATSKLNNEEDLFKIATLGFRGEALSSMAAVSKMNIITKTKENNSGINLTIENGEVKEVNEVGVPEGTRIELQDLFYNVPARKNYLKDDATEFRHILDIVQKYTLSNQNVSFRLIHNGKEVINAASSEDPLAKIIALFGKDFAKELLPVSVNLEGDYPRSIKGFIGKPTINRADRSAMVTFVNNRYVKNQILSDSIFNAYDTMLNTQRYPVAILNFDLPLDRIDVNVHPSKTVIKIQKELDVSDWITGELRKLLHSSDLVPKAKLKPVGVITSDTLEKFNPENTQMPTTDLKKMLEGFSKERENTAGKHGPTDAVPTNQEILEKAEEKREEVVEEKIEPSAPPVEAPEKYKILGVVHKTYVLIETKEGLRVVDQHAAHERVQYEIFKKSLMAKSMAKQSLLNGMQIDMGPEEKQLTLQHKNNLAVAGFDIEDFGGNTILLRSLPSVLGKQQSMDLFKECISIYRKEGVSPDPVKQMADNFIKTMGCKSAIKAGDDVGAEHLVKILQDLDKCENKFTCPHGRPISIEITATEFEKLFNRERGHESVA
jgi:DNA mismatch repair protein MutL